MKKLLSVVLLASILVVFGCTKTTPTPNDVVLEPTIDLTNCISYFDGCNTCTVEDGKPNACTLMYCDTPTGEPKCLEYKNIDAEIEPTIDLTDCISYFDGCNTCMVEDGVIGGCTKMHCETLEEPKCLETK